MGKLRVGICGYGGLGRLHTNNLAKMDDVEIAAVCDTRAEQLAQKKVETNLGAEQAQFDIGTCRTYTDFNVMLRKESLDVVFTALPTDLHASHAIKALKAGCHVFSEKPMALTSRECDKMTVAAEKYGKKLMIGQCLRFWPEYEFLQKCIDEKLYGRLLTLTMTRIGGYSVWTAGDWMNDGKRSGGAILDLHLHDVDWVFHALGKPDTLCAAGLAGKTGDIDDVTAIWRYDNGPVVAMRGSWLYQGFTMSFQAFFEKGALDFGVYPEPALNVRLPGSDKREKVALEAGSGHLREVRYFLDCVKNDKLVAVCAPASTRESVALIEIERKAIKTGKWLKVG